MGGSKTLPKRQQGRNMSFDPMAAAIDWLDAYRAGDLESILEMYADDATLECGCSGGKMITGREAIRAYWVKRLRDYPASELDDMQPLRDVTAISYLTKKGPVSAVLAFDDQGLIAFQQCGPSAA